jgi:hypothetical protein
MKTYTLFFPSPVNPPIPLPDNFTLGTPFLMDGLATGHLPDDRPVVALGDRRTKPDLPLLLHFDQERPPEIVNGYVFDTDLRIFDGEVFLVQSQFGVRQREESAGPIIVRISTLCDTRTILHGTIKVCRGDPKMIASGSGFNAYSDETSGVWYDSIFQMSVGDSISVRPAGLDKVLDWVVEYGEIGLTFKPLEANVGS